MTTISKEERYKQLFEMWRFASEIRFKILAAWLAVYAGLAVVFAWLWGRDELQPLAISVPVIGILATWLFWSMDKRNGGAIQASRNIIEKLEAAQGIPSPIRIVSRTQTKWYRTHHFTICCFAWIMTGILGYLTFWIYLYEIAGSGSV